MKTFNSNRVCAIKRLGFRNKPRTSLWMRTDFGTERDIRSKPRQAVAHTTADSTACSAGCQLLCCSRVLCSRLDKISSHTAFRCPTQFYYETHICTLEASPSRLAPCHVKYCTTGLASESCNRELTLQVSQHQTGAFTPIGQTTPGTVCQRGIHYGKTRRALTWWHHNSVERRLHVESG